MVVDGHKSQASFDTYDTQWGKIIKEYQVRQSWIQPHCWWQNGAERVVGEIRRDMRSLQSFKQSPKRLWAYLVQYICGRRQQTASSASTAMGRTGFELVKGYTPDISLYLAHDWYDYVWWFDLQDKSMKLGRWLGPAGLQFGGMIVIL